MKSKAIVTLADKNYFELLLEVIASIKKAEWDIEVAKYKVAGKEWLKSQVSRAFIPNYFPEFEKYLWIDCDAWINSWDTVELYFEACKNGKLGITQTIGAGYKVLTKVSWVFGKLALIKSQNYKHAKKSGFSETTARKLAFAPHLNIGVFSLEKKSECWKLWQTLLDKALSAGGIFGSEGLAINIAVYDKNADVEFLPLSCNWIASNVLPKFDEENQTFVEPYLPHKKIGIMHLAAGIWKDNRDMRIDKSVKISIQTVKGSWLQKSLRYGH